MKVDTAEEASDTVSPGVIIRQELLSPGTQFNPAAASEIRLVYASYPTIVIPSDIEGKAIDEAVSELEALGAKCLTSNLDTTSLSDEEIANLKTGIVIKSDPEIGSEYTQKEDNYVILYYY
jgi:beta-lactam-binding protein with PASTA domain